MVKPRSRPFTFPIGVTTAAVPQAGVPVTAVRFEGMIHDFVMLNALADTQAAHGAMVLANNLLREAFSK
jgi:acetyl esterase/lipase